MRLLCLAALSLAAAAAPAPALAAADPRADDAARLFSVMCLTHQDGGAYAKTAFDHSPEAAQRLDAAQLLQVVGPQLGTGFGWVMTTPAGGEAVLAYAPALNACSVVVRAAEADSMREELAIAVEPFVTSVVSKGGTSTTAPETSSLVGGISVTQMGWDITAKDGAQWTITALIAAKPNAERQHLLTLSRVK